MLIYTRHDPRYFDRRLYKSGGDGGANQMREDETARQLKVQAAVDAINGKFGKGGPILADENAYLAENPDVAAQIGLPGKFKTAREHWDMYGRNENRHGGIVDDPASAQAGAARESMYGDISSAVRDTAMRDLDRQYSEASKKNKFGLARANLLGGSVDAESGGQLQELYGEGRLKATQAGQQSAADLRTSDERTRQNLISLAQSGLDTGAAASMAESQMGAAADLARSQTAGASVGRLFDDMTQAYVTNQYMKTRYPNGMPGQQPTGYAYNGFNPSRYTGNVQN